jgi:hypothetical protein
MTRKKKGNLNNALSRQDIGNEKPNRSLVHYGQKMNTLIGIRFTTTKANGEPK